MLEKPYSSRQTNETQFSEVRSIGYNVGVMFLWTLVEFLALRVDMHRNPISAVLLFVAVEFLFTGLFIVTHDSIHGNVSRAFPTLNRNMGVVAISCFAWFDYDMLKSKHRLHHVHTGKIEHDPDFHRGDSSFGAWFGGFMLSYLTISQLAKIGIYILILHLAFKLSLLNIIAYVGAAPIVSAVRLFYFGTFLPHRPSVHGGETTGHGSRSSGSSVFVSFFKCYHFDYHWEHHRWPRVPWFDLPFVRRV